MGSPWSTTGSTTATVKTEDLSVDLAQTRTETYPTPGTLPVVAPATLADDLRRRDFTINAMAVALRGDELGHLHDPHGGRRDLDHRLIRVLHDDSFLDDPTRLFRAARYETRLGFRMDPHTERLARDAVEIGAMKTLTGTRVRDALFLLLAEHDAPSALAPAARPGRRPRPGSRTRVRRRRWPPAPRSGRARSGRTACWPCWRR